MKSTILLSTAVMPCIVAWLALPVFAQAPAERKSEAARAEYWRDARLKKAVAFTEEKPGTLDREAEGRRVRAHTTARQGTRLVNVRLLDGAAVLQAIQEQTGVPLAIQTDWGEEAVAVPRRGGEARELMDGLAQAFEARWIRFDAAWVLAKSQVEAQLTMMSPQERGAASTNRTRSFIQSITPAQWQRLLQGTPVGLGEFTPSQRQAMIETLRLQYYDPQRAMPPGPAAVLGKGVQLRYITESGIGPVLDVTGPGRRGEFGTGIPFYDTATGALMWGIAPPR